VSGTRCYCGQLAERRARVIKLFALQSMASALKLRNAHVNRDRACHGWRTSHTKAWQSCMRPVQARLQPRSSSLSILALFHDGYPLVNSVDLATRLAMSVDETGLPIPTAGNWPVDPQQDVPVEESRLWIDGCFDFSHHGIFSQSSSVVSMLMIGCRPRWCHAPSTPSG